MWCLRRSAQPDAGWGTVGAAGMPHVEVTCVSALLERPHVSPDVAGRAEGWDTTTGWWQRGDVAGQQLL